METANKAITTKDLKKTEVLLQDNMTEMGTRLQGNMNEMEVRLEDKIAASESRLEEKINKTETRLNKKIDDLAVDVAVLKVDVAELKSDMSSVKRTQGLILETVDGIAGMLRDDKTESLAVEHAIQRREKRLNSHENRTDFLEARSA